MILNILDYLEQSGDKYPDKIAFADEKKSVTYLSLINQARNIGAILANSINSQLRKPVVVFVDRNIECLISFMGIAYSGNFYVPIDSKMPKQRVELMFDTLQPVAAITISASDLEMLDSINYNGIRLQFQDAALQTVDTSLLNSIRKRHIDIDPVYAIFTSGSTGVPKGVVINHKSVIDLTEWLVSTFSFTQDDVIGNQTPFYFDGSVKDIYIAIKTGATLYIVPRKCFAFPKLLADFLNEKQVTAILWATSAVCLVGNSNILAEQEFKHINKVFFAGEAMPAKQLNVWRKHIPKAKYINLYGPTEITVDCTYFEVDRDFPDDEYIPIGFPCRNKEIIILNDQNQHVNADESGELCVRGTGVALGYYNNPEKTKEVFIQNPMHNFYEDIIYRTGDIVKYNTNNEIVFLSRKDFQVKHMGNRIELGEIEVTVNAIENITNASCIYDSEAQKIVLYYTTDNGKELDIINSIKNNLPKYMFPNISIHIEKMPYNFNGKIDRLKLKELYQNEKNR